MSDIVVACERSRARQHLEQHAAERPDVRALVHRLAARLLGAHVRRRAEDHAVTRRRGQVMSVGDVRIARRRTSPFEGFGQTEVEHFHRAVGAHLDVRGLQIAVDDALLVRGFERVGDLPGDRQRLSERHRPARDPLREILALDQLQHEGLDAVGLLEAVNGADVGMIERGKDARLPLQARQSGGMGPERSREILMATSRPSRVSCAR